MNQLQETPPHDVYQHVNDGCPQAIRRCSTKRHAFDQVRGPLHTLGSHEIEIVGENTLGVTIEDWGLNLEQAKAIFYPRCEPRLVP
jgi:hypothetical protein